VDFPPRAGDSAPAGVSEERGPAGVREERGLRRGQVAGLGHRRRPEACVRACGRADKVRSADGHGMVRRGAGWVVQRHLPCLASELKYTPTPCGQAEIRVRAPCARDAGLAGEGEGGVACSWEAHRRIRNVRRGPAAACGRPAPTRRARCGGGAGRGRRPVRVSWVTGLVQNCSANE